MLTVRIRVIGAKPIYDRYGRARPVADRVLRQTVQEQTQLMVSTLRRFTPVGATGRLRKSTKGYLSKTPAGYESRIVQDASRGSYQYQEGVNLGTRPHFPPPAGLLAWVRFKWGVSGKAALAAARALAAHIARYGTRPNPYVARAYQAALPGLRRIGRRAGVLYRSMMTRG